MSESKEAIQQALAKVTHKKQMIREVLGVISTEVLLFEKAIREQDTALSLLAERICLSAKAGESYVQAVQAKDKAYKQSVVRLGLSLAKLGLSVIGAQELIDVAADLSELAAGSLEHIESKLDNLVDKIGENVVLSEKQAIQEADRALLQPQSPDDLQGAWLLYRDILHTKACEGINNVLEKSLKTDDFAWCTILSCMEQKPDATPEEWVDDACEKAKQYVRQVYQTLLERTQLITKVKNAALAQPHQLTNYFIKTGLIDYTLAHEEKKGIQSWLSSKLGRELNRHFPEVVFQHDIRPRLFGSRKRANKRKEAESKAKIQLHSGPNSTKRKQDLYSVLEEKRSELNDELVTMLQAGLPKCLEADALQHLPSIESSKGFHENERSARYSFSSTRTKCLFDPASRQDSEASLYKLKKARQAALRSYSLQESSRSKHDAESLSEKAKRVPAILSDSVLEAWVGESGSTVKSPKRSKSFMRPRSSMFLPSDHRPTLREEQPSPDTLEEDSFMNGMV